MPVIPLNGPPVNQGRRSTERLNMTDTDRLTDVLDGVVCILVTEPMTEEDWTIWHGRVEARFEQMAAGLTDDEYHEVRAMVAQFLRNTTHDEWRWAGVWNYAADLW